MNILNQQMEDHKELEITFKKFSELSNNNNDTFRFDAEHYQYKYIKIIEKINQHNNEPLISLIKKPVTTGHTPSMKIDRFYNGEIPFIKTDNVRENSIVESFTDFLSQEGSDELISSNLETNDILLTIIGANFSVVGRSAIVRKENLPANINQNVALIQPDESKISSDYLNIYLNTVYGKGCLHFHSRQTEQVNLNCREVEYVLIPRFSELENIVHNLSETAYGLTVKSKSLYRQAEDILNEYIGFDNEEPIFGPINIKKYSESFLLTERIDAEYYQKKYEYYLKLVTSNPNGYTFIKDEFNHINKKSDKVKTSYKYIEIGDVDIAYGTVLPNIIETVNLPDNAKTEAKMGDIIISKVRPNRGAISIIDITDNDLIISGAFTVLRKKEESEFKNEVLQALLRTNIYRQWLLQFNIGTQYPVIRDENILNLVIPKIDSEIQLKISTLIKEALHLKIQSESLFSSAKRAVEIAIEDGETKALTYLIEVSK